MSSRVVLYTHNLIIFKTKIKVHLNPGALTRNKIEKEPNDRLKFKIPKLSDLYHCGRLRQGQDCFS